MPTEPSPQLTAEQYRLVENHSGLAVHIAVAFWKRAPTLFDRDELVSVAYQGLVSAAIRFDPTRRPDPPDAAYDPLLAFAPFARTRITGAVQDWLRSEDHVPRRQRKIYRDIQRLGPGKSPLETAALLGLDPRKVQAVRHAVENPPVSLDTYATTEAETYSTLAEASRAVADGPDSEMMTRLVQLEVCRVFESMGSVAKSVMALRYYMGLDFVSIASELGISPSKVRAVHQEAVADVHSAMIRVVRH